jgi:CPA2 family monovalent cation:H+ antiporter-2
METSGLLVALTTTLLAAAIGGAVAVRLGQSPLVGYIVAGIAIGPATPGFVGDLEVVSALADIGVIFLMFSVGAQVSFHEFRRVGPVATVGGVAQVVVSIAIGTAIGLALGWSLIAAVFLGAFTSISSTAVASRVVGERGELETDHGVVAIGWLAVQDLATILLIVALSAVGGSGDLPDIALAVGKAAVFLAVLLPVGGWLIPRLFEALANFRRRELFILGVVGVALGTAALGALFGISLALGAFLAGMLVAGSDLSHQVVGETVPFRDVFSGLFFVSVGMFVDPGLVLANLPLLALVLALVVPVKGAIVAAIARMFRYPVRTSALAGILLAQSAEFSFVLGRIGRDLGAVSEATFGLMLSGAAVSIALAPAAFSFGRTALTRLERRGLELADPAAVAPDPAEWRRVAVICGYGRVGRIVGSALERRGFRFVVIEQDPRLIADARSRGIHAIRGPAENRIVLERAPLDRAAVLVVALPDPIAVRLVVDTARRAHPRLPIVARTHSLAERAVLRDLGASAVIVGETELGLEITRFTLRQFGLSGNEVQALINGLRER